MAHNRKPHAIMIPIPHQGHINPFTNLALKLASNDFVVTFINLEFVHHMLSQSHHKEDDIFCEARKSGLDIRYATISDGFPVEFDRVLYLDEFWESMLKDFPARVDELVGNIIESFANLAHFLVVDTLFAWHTKIAEKYKVVNVSFWTEPAVVFSLTFHSELLREKGHFPCQDGVEEEINYIPGIESINTKDFMPYLKQSDVTTVSHKLVFAAYKEVKNADFILHNTVHELESETLLALNNYQPNYAIGPTNFSKNLGTNIASKSLLPESDCTRWLDSKSPGSVLYVSFGSLVQTNSQVIEEIAYGLLLSEVEFIWAIRVGLTGSVDTNVLPNGFEDVVKDRGLIIPWCNQIEVLSNAAVGGFVTHCGWNSILESIWHGVPMICYPVTYDQPTNRKLVVNDWRVGINLCDGKSVDRNEVAEKIKSLVSGTTSKRLRRDIVEVRAKLQNAVEIDGSSERNFDQFVKDLKKKVCVETENKL